MTDSNDFKFKIALIGDSSTGKSTLLRRLIGEHNLNCNDQNNNDSSPHEKTIGVDFKRYNLILPESNVNVALSFYDTSGDPLYRHITLSYLDNVQGYLIAYDVQNMESFLNCQYWHNEINKRHNCTETCNFLFNFSKIYLTTTNHQFLLIILSQKKTLYAPNQSPSRLQE